MVPGIKEGKQCNLLGQCFGFICMHKTVTRLTKDQTTRTKMFMMLHWMRLQSINSETLRFKNHSPAPSVHSHIQARAMNAVRN